jgi:hypothetical protein
MTFVIDALSARPEPYSGAPSHQHDVWVWAGAVERA